MCSDYNIINDLTCGELGKKMREMNKSRKIDGKGRPRGTDGMEDGTKGQRKKMKEKYIWTGFCLTSVQQDPVTGKSDWQIWNQEMEGKINKWGR